MAIDTSNWLNINRESWDERTKMHLDSDFYDVDGFKDGKDTLNDIEINLLGIIQSKRILHLQCHFGMDTFSLEKKGAIVTGVDFSPGAISSANKLKNEMGFSSEFICSNVYDLDLSDSHSFDSVFCSYGITGWLPNLDDWAKVISLHLNSGGTFVIVDFHPLLWMFDDDFKNIGYSYFNDKPYIETESGSYANRESGQELTSIWWSHSLSEITQALINNGFALETFEEYNYSPYNCFQNTIKIEKNKYRIKHLDSKIPMVYAMVYKKNRDD